MDEPLGERQVLAVDALTSDMVTGGVLVVHAVEVRRQAMPTPKAGLAVRQVRSWLAELPTRAQVAAADAVSLDAAISFISCRRRRRRQRRCQSIAP